jgi:ABC-type nitrate/sulfonate/bicarbonate transport system substrate-binding protein
MLITRRGMLGGLGVLTVTLPPLSAIADNLRKVSIGLSSMTFAPAPARVADKMGIFAKHGFAPSFVVLDSGNAATAALLSGSLQVIVGGPGEHVAAAARGQDIVAIANVYQGLGGSLILSKVAAEKIGVAPDAPIVQRLRALDGLLIGSSSATSSYTVAVKSAADSAGASVRFTYMAQTVTPGAMEKGAIDGFMASAPVWSVPVISGNGLLWLSGPGGDFPAEYAPASSTSIQMMRPTAEKDPTLVKAFRDTFAEFVTILKERPDEVKAAVAALYPDLSSETIEVLFQKEAIAWAAKPLTVDDMRHEIAFVKTAGANLPGVDKNDPAKLLFR